MIPPLPVFLAGAHLVIAAADVPTLNIAPGCRAAASGSLGLTQDFESCMRSENGARDELAKQWDAFPPADRAGCHRLTTMGTGGTYTELLTCPR